MGCLGGDAGTSLVLGRELLDLIICRICPGRHLADANLWLTFARVLAVFDIKKPVDANGIELDEKISFHTGITRYVS